MVASVTVWARMESVRDVVCETSLDPCKVRTQCHRSRLKTRQFGPSYAWLSVSVTRCSSALALLPCQFPRGNATKVRRHSTSTRPVGVMSEQCQHGTSPRFDCVRRVVSPAPVSFQSIRSAEAVSEKIASAVSTSESATLGVRPLPCRSRLFK